MNNSGDLSWVTRLREHCHGSSSSLLRGADVFPARNLEKALHRARQASDSTVVVVAPQVPVFKPLDGAWQDLEVVVIGKSRDWAGSAAPDASILPGRSQISVSHTPGEAVRKAFLRLELRRRFEIRQPTADELPGYLQLRHRVWREIGYQREDIGGASEWELDFYDRASIPLVAYPLGGSTREPVACVRLLFEAGADHRIAADLDRLVQRSGHVALQTALRWPAKITSPFDMLREFPSFQPIYARYVQRSVRKAELSRVIVSAAFRRIGLGESMVDTAIRIAERNAVRVLFLACLERHAALYRRSGFVEISGARSERFGRLDVPAIGMIRPLEE